MTSTQVIRSYLIIAGLYTLSSSLIWGVNTLFLLEAGLNIAEVFIANAAWTAGMVIFEIPTGVLADTSGRRASFLLSVFFVLIATIGYVIVGETSGSLGMFMFMSVILGLGFTFYSGAVEAWLVDALNATGYDQELDHIFAQGAMITGASMLIGSVSGGIIGTLDLSLPYIVRAGLLVIVFGVAYFMMHDLGYEPKALKLGRIPAEMQRILQASVRFGWQEPHLRLLMLVAFIQAGFTGWAFYASQPYFVELYGDPDAVWVAGVVAALLSIATIIGNWIVDRLTRFCGRRTTIMLAGMTIFVFSMIGVGVADTFWISVPLFLLAMGTLGVIGPVRQSYIHHLIPTEQRATVISVDAMFGSGGGIVSQVGLGQLALNNGIAQGYIVGGVFSLICIPILVKLRSMGGVADPFGGRPPSHQGAHAAQGLPESTHVDSKPHHPLPETGD